MVALETLKRRGQEEATQLAEVVDLPAAEERLRADIAAFWARVPEPPAYRRKEEPLRQRAGQLLEEAVPLWARCEQLKISEAVQPYVRALDAHLTMLALLADGQVEAADEAWRAALGLEREAARANRLWTSSEEATSKVYDRSSGTSRYDPQPDVTWKVHLLCPQCRAPGDFRFSPRHATHRFVCQSCQATFQAYFAELRALEVARTRSRHRYVFRVEELSGAQTRIELDDGGATELAVARRDLVAFLYSGTHELKAVLNLTSSRIMWTRSPSACFLATAVYGEGATELDDFRAFRDRVLVPHALGRVAVKAYYAVGPHLAKGVRASPSSAAAARWALDRVHRRLRVGR